MYLHTCVACLQLYDHVAEAEITLMNTGRVGFDFCGLGMDPSMAAKPLPGIPIMIPHQGFIEPGEQKSLLVRFIPAVPEKFNKSFLVQVAHFQPENVNLFGEGVFPRVSLDLPRVLDDGYDSLLKEAAENVENETKKVHRSTSAASQQRAQPLSSDMLVVRL